MSSLNSRQVPTFAEHRDAVAAAVVEVSENSFFAFVTPAEWDLFTDLLRTPHALEADFAAETWMQTRVAFDGAFRGILQIVMPERLARELLAAFVGLGPDDPVEPPQLVDAAGEFATQVCGTWLTSTCHRRRFDLKAPEVVHMASAWQPVGIEAAREDGGELYFTINDRPVKVALQFVPFGTEAA